MKPNLHKYDRVIRVILGLGIASMAFWGPSNYWFLLGLILPATSFVSWCPIYAALGLRTNKAEEKK
jgi:hypothetical protein